MRAAEQAHASRFAQADGLAEPPLWLTLGTPSEPLRFLGRFWHRRWPLSGIATLAMTVATAVLVPADAPAWTLALLCAGFALVAFSRVFSLPAEPAWSTTQWLGAPLPARSRAFARLGFGLAVPLLGMVGLQIWHRQGTALVGLVLGVTMGWFWMANAGSRTAWIQRGAWLLYGAGLAASIMGAT